MQRAGKQFSLPPLRYIFNVDINDTHFFLYSQIFTASIIVHVIPRFILILDLGRFYREHLPPNGDFHPGLWLFILSGAMEVVGLVGLTILPSHNHKTFQVSLKSKQTMTLLVKLK